MSDLSRLRLLQLSSPTLPVGAYTYSQGLEWAIDSGLVKNEAGVQAWISDLLAGNIGSFEAPMLIRLMEAFRNTQQSDGLLHLSELNARYLASRETSELRAETVQMGYSMLKLLTDLPDFPAVPLAVLQTLSQPSFPTAWACAAAAWEVDIREALCAYVWAWAENQVMAAIKAVPLGQTAGQRMLLVLGARIPDVVEHSLKLEQHQLCNFAPGFAIASSRHETQYSRLFRS
jgi:urease accessory protein